MDDKIGLMDRRHFIGGLGALGAAGLIGLRPALAAAPPETSRIRIGKTSAICMAPHFVAEDLLRSEGFENVQYVSLPDLDATERALAAGEIDINVNYALRLVYRLDAGDPVVVLGGLHVGCIELLVHDHIRSIRDLTGKRLAAGRVASGVPQDVELIKRPASEAVALFLDGGADAFIDIPPEPQEIRARSESRVLLDTSSDRPWSQYFCCMVSANRGFHRNNPVASKRALRALVKAAELCGTQPERSARLLVDRGHTPNYAYALDTLRGIPYRAWREFNPEEALRFYALRLREAGVIKANPRQLIDEGTDWRALNELRTELKV
jgi:NitT/TauT family transport system substrate-binding protein